MTQLASDLNNTDFANPINPDTLLSVEFYMYEPIDKWESDKKSYDEGRKVVIKKDEQPYVRIMKPGDSTSIITQPVREDHKRRFPREWLYFQQSNGLIDEGQIAGWKIEDWEHLNSEQIRDLKHMRFYTVEQIAGASDSSIQGMGIMGPGLREAAKKALRATLQNQIKDSEEKKDKQIADLTAQMEDMKKTIEAMIDPEASAKPAKKDG